MTYSCWIFGGHTFVTEKVKYKRKTFRERCTWCNYEKEYKIPKWQNRRESNVIL